MKLATPQRDLWLCGALLALYAGLAVPALVLDSSVADEHPHILSGWLYWESGRPSGGLDNPPLGQLLVAAPLRLARAAYAFPADTHLALARLPVLLMSLGLALLVARWAVQLGGRRLAVVALAFLCLEPNLLAHGHLATLDAPLTCLWWLALWQWRGVLGSLAAAGAVPWRGATLFAVALGLAVFTKFTGFLLLPAALGVGLLVLRRRAKRASVMIVAATLAGLALAAHLVYAFEPVRFGLPQHLVQALGGKLAHRDAGHFAYLLGRRSQTGFLEYYLVVLLLKTPLPLLGLAASGVVLGWRRSSHRDRWLLTLPAALVLVAFSFVRVDIGVRHILPVYPALVLWAAVGAQLLWQRGRAWRLVVGLLVGLWGAGVGRVVPQYLAYFNIIAGGARGGDRCLLDSNLAWGQDDARLVRFLARAAERGEAWEVNPPGETARAGNLVVDVNTLHQLLRADAEPYAWLRPLPARGGAGHSWRVYALALDDFESRARQRPAEAAAQIAYAEALRAHGDTSAADSVYARAAALPDAVAVARSAASTALAGGDFDGAESWVRRGLALQPTDRTLHAMMQRLRLERRFAAGARGSGRDALELGLWWAERGEVDKALPWLQRAAAERPHDPEAVRSLAVGLAQQGEFAAAARLVERSAVRAALATDLNALQRLAATDAAVDAPADSGFTRAAWMELGAALFRIRHYDRAAAVCIEILRHDPADDAALALLCEMQVRAKLRIVAAGLTPRAAPGERRAP